MNQAYLLPQIVRAALAAACLCAAPVGGAGNPDALALSGSLAEPEGDAKVGGHPGPDHLQRLLDEISYLEEPATVGTPPATSTAAASQPVPAGHTADPPPTPVRHTTRAHMLEEVDATWQRPMVFERPLAAQTLAGEDELRDRLQRIFIPHVEFRELPLSTVVEALGEIAAAAGEPDAPPVNMVLLDPAGLNPRVSLTLRRLSLQRVLDFLAEAVGFDYEVQRDAVVLRARQGVGHGLETAFYPIGRSTLIRLTGLREVPDSLATNASIQDDPFAPPATEPTLAIRSQTELQLKSFLQRAGVSFDSVDGADLALADGQLIVTQTPRNHEKVRRILQRYRETRQVEIEARFIEVQQRNLEELGFEWTVAGRTLSGGNAPARNLANAFSVGRDESRLVIERDGTETTAIGHGAPVLPTTVDLAEAASPLVRLQTVLDGVQVQGIMRALERQSGNDLLSAPKLTVLSGKTAEIVVAEEFRYPEAYGDMSAEVGRGDSNSGSAGVAITAGTPRSFTTRNVGVEMEVTATVEEDSAISLRLRPKVTEFEGFVEYGGTSVAIASNTTVTVPSGFYQPIFSIRRIDTEVTVWDGATVVMGGLTREHAVRIKDRVPLLGSLPLLGALFRSEGESTQKRNLLIFVTANLVSPGGSPAFQFLPDLEPGTLFQQPVLSLPDGQRRRAPSRSR